MTQNKFKVGDFVNINGHGESIYEVLRFEIEGSYGNKYCLSLVAKKNNDILLPVVFGIKEDRLTHKK